MQTTESTDSASERVKSNGWIEAKANPLTGLVRATDLLESVVKGLDTLHSPLLNLSLAEFLQPFKRHFTTGCFRDGSQAYACRFVFVQ
jgi:hypothetical protein